MRPDRATPPVLELAGAAPTAPLREGRASARPPSLRAERSNQGAGGCASGAPRNDGVDLIPPDHLLLRICDSAVPEAPITRVLVPAGPSLADLAVDHGPAAAMEVWARHGWAAVAAAGREPVAVPREAWCRVRPRAGATVTLAIVAGDSQSLQVAALLAITVAAIAVSGGALGPAGLALGATFGAGGLGAIVGAGVISVGGGLIATQAFPVKPPRQRLADTTETRLLTRSRNSLIQDGETLSLVFGRRRVVPVLAAQPIVEVVGTETWIRLLLAVAANQGTISAIRIGDRAIEDVAGAEWEVRQGLPDDTPIGLFSGTPDYDEIGLEIRADDAEPYVYTTAENVNEATVLLEWFEGLWGTTDNSGQVTDRVGEAAIAWRPVGGGAWTALPNVVEERQQASAFLVPVRIVFPAAGQYEISPTKVSLDDRERTHDRIRVRAVQTLRYASPVNLGDRKVPLLALRVQADSSTQGELEAVSCLFESLIEDWDSETEEWAVQATRNHASIARSLWHGEWGFFSPPYGIDEPDWIALHGRVAEAGLACDAEIRDGSLTWPLIQEVLAAVQARPVHRAGRLGLAVEDWAAPLDDLVTPADSQAIEFRMTARAVPEVLRVSFVEEGETTASTRLIVRKDLVEAAGIEDPGALSDLATVQAVEADLGRPLLSEARTYRTVSDPARVAALAQYELGAALLRAREIRVSKRTDIAAFEDGLRIKLTAPWAEMGLAAGRVRQQLDARTLILDRPVSQEAGASYVLELRGGQQAVTTVALVTQPGRATRVTTAADVEAGEGTVWTLGTASTEAIDCFCRGVERGEGLSGTLVLVDRAPELADWLTFAPPAWSGRRAASQELLARAPAVPRVVGIASGTGIAQIEADGTIRDRVAVVLAPGSDAAAAPTDSYEVRWRLDGASAWQPAVQVPAVAGEAWLTGPTRDQAIEVEARALSARRRPSAWADAVAHTVGTRDLPPPDPTALSVTEGLYGRRTYQPSARPEDVGFAGWIYRARSGSDVGWTWDDLAASEGGIALTGEAPVAVSPWESWQPLEAGSWTVGVATVSTTGVLCEAPYLTVVELTETIDPDVLLRRSESDEGWPGTLEHAAVSGSDLVFDGVGGSDTLVYTTPNLSFGRTITGANVIVDVDASDTVTVEMAYGTSPDPAGWGPVGPITGPASDIRIRITGPSGTTVTIYDLTLFIRRTA